MLSLSDTIVLGVSLLPFVLLPFPSVAGRTLTETGDDMPSVLDLVGQTFGRLTVVERAGSSKNLKALWRCRCDCGNEIVVLSSGLRTSDTRSCGCLRRERSREQARELAKNLVGKEVKEIVEYVGAHYRVRRARGLPSTYDCFHCDKPAEEWAYTHNDPEERISSKEFSNGNPYSLRPSYYVPLCRSCHRTLDYPR